MIDKIKFIPATTKDIPLLCEIRKKQLIDEGIDPCINIDQQLKDFFEQNFQNQTIYEILAYMEENVIATGAVCFYSYPPTYTNQSGKVAYITNMYTDKNYRKKGIASHILQILENEVRNRNIEVMRLGASSLGKPVYEKFGFQSEEVMMIKRIKICESEK